MSTHKSATWIAVVALLIATAVLLVTPAGQPILDNIVTYFANPTATNPAAQ